ncbi:RcnB family protein [Ramlibacter sp.]|uniref:RcnB family protein n=1 Tax=Ramlibacter sp. TaxID=1917967 RepID=UPI0039C8CA91
MKSIVLACALAAAAVGLAAPAQADPGRHGAGPRWSAQQGGDGDWRGRGQEQRPYGQRAEPAPEPQRGWERRGGGRWQQPEHPPAVEPVPPRGQGRRPPPQFVPPPQPQFVPPPAPYQPPQWQGQAAPPRPQWHQAPRLRPGDVLPPEYRQREYVVKDWRAHRLYAPPPGYQWVQPEAGDYLLISPNGQIANMLIGQ